jgi:RNA polymerase sigma-70 factor (ECF subfamily)
MSGGLGDLVDRATRGEGEAVEVLLQRYLPSLRAFLRLRAGRLLLEKESCSDLAQSVCRDVLENMERFRYAGEAGFKRWLFTTAQRKIADRYEYYLAKKRTSEREHRAADVSSVDQEILGSYRSFYTPSEQAVAREELQRLEQVFDQLTEDQQQVILLDRIVGMSRAEIAQEMGRNEAAVKSLLFRALSRLGELLGS